MSRGIAIEMFREVCGRYRFSEEEADDLLRMFDKLGVPLTPTGIRDFQKRLAEGAVKS